MSELSDKLKSLGVKVGAQDVQPQEKPAAQSALEIILGGGPLQTHMGETYLVEARYPTGQSHGRARLTLESPRRMLAGWARDPRLADLAPTEFAFLDTETTGLSGGTGTYAFLVGAARFEQDGLHLAQFFMRGPQEEMGQLAALEEFLAPCRALVTFNGKSFDAPLLRTRYAAYQWQPLLNELAHLDLMHLAQRLWRKRLTSYTLKMLEAHILGVERNIDDVPGWEIPEIYFTYLHDHNPEPLKRVFYHNAMDVISLAALLDHMAGMLEDPQGKASEYGADLIALARLYEDLGDQPAAARLYEDGLDHQDARSEQMPRAARVQGLRRLGAIHKQHADWPAALELWELAAGQQDLEAHIELAMCYEHTLHDLSAALHWTQAAISLVTQGRALTQDGKPLKPYERRQRLVELEHRLERLKRKEIAASQHGN